MQELETLLNSLIQMGWEPWGKDVDKITIPPKEQFDEDRYLFVDVMFPSGFSRYYTQRELVSYNSGLWQFVCEKDFYKHDQWADSDWIKNIEDTRDSEKGIANYFTQADFRYRLIESALVPEEELGQFLVDNIKVEGK